MNTSKLELDRAHFRAHFTPQAWVNDSAIDVDPDGPTDWDCTDLVRGDDEVRAYLFDLIESDPDAFATGVIDDEDIFRDDPQAPAWVQDWSGPFTIVITVTAPELEERL